MLTLDERIEKDNVRIEVKFVDTVTWFGHPAHQYKVKLLRKGRQWTLKFWSGINNSEPEARDVLHCIISDSHGYQNSSGFWNWADEYGHTRNDEFPSEEKEKEVRKIYDTIKAQTARAEKFFGGDLYKYVEETDWMI